MKAIALNSKIDESRDFAAAVQESMVKGVRDQHPVPDRGVHTAPFYVLIGANMPAVLAEIAFVSNPEDEKRLKSPEYREKNMMTRDKAVEIVTRAYRSVLGRDPDPAGLESYVQGVLRNKWTEADVARELRKSDEYRNKRIGA